MSQPYVGEIRMFAGDFAPNGWMFCQGQLLPISEYETLFNLIGTTYGGDGQFTFALPDLQGRFPMHQGNSHIIGEQAGVETVTLTTQQIPAHNHAANFGIGGNSPSPAGNIWSSDPSGNTPLYNSAAGSSMAASSVASSGGSRPHENRQPFLVVNFIISLFGVFPPQS